MINPMIIFALTRLSVEDSLRHPGVLPTRVAQPFALPCPAGCVKDSFVCSIALQFDGHDVEKTSGGTALVTSPVSCTEPQLLTLETGGNDYCIVHFNPDVQGQ